MARKLNIALVGCSAMGKLHAEGIVANGCVNFYAICDTAKERLEEFKSIFDVDVVTEDYLDLVNDPALDAVVIVTPDQIHREMTVAFLRAGKAVLCEKPMALTLEDCEEMMRAEREMGGKLMIGQVCRFTPAFILAKQIIDSGRIGELVFVESEYAHNYNNARGYNDWRVVPERHGVVGGGCHAIDLLRWIAGDPTEVYAHANHKILTDWPVDDTTIAIYKFPNNVSGKAFISIGCKRGYTMRSCFYGTKGTIICDNKSPTLTLFEEKDGTGFTEPQSIPIDINNHNATAEIKCFVDALVKGEAMPVSSREGASTVAVCCATVKSTKSGKPEEIVYPSV